MKMTSAIIGFIVGVIAGGVFGILTTLVLLLEDKRDDDK